MEKLFEKISSYNIFNFIIPGAVFTVISEHLEILFPPSKEILAEVIWYYFVGAVVSRVGSVIIEPLLRWLRFVKHAPYTAYLEACEKDPKMETMVEVANTYRTLLSGFLLLIVGLLLSWAAGSVALPPIWKERIGIGALLLLFLVSYRKQVQYVAKRVQHYKVS